eukprot:1160056-Pelagomonas_calceolata.AAC.3
MAEDEERRLSSFMSKRAAPMSRRGSSVEAALSGLYEHLRFCGASKEGLIPVRYTHEQMKQGFRLGCLIASLFLKEKEPGGYLLIRSKVLALQQRDFLIDAIFLSTVCTAISSTGSTEPVVDVLISYKRKDALSFAFMLHTALVLRGVGCLLDYGACFVCHVLCRVFSCT